MLVLPEDHILIYSDGACSGNPGPGGWGSIVLTPDHQVQELGGFEAGTTNNRMEIMAALSALEFVRELNHPVWLYTDSTYLIRGITQWIFGWQKRDWKSSSGEGVANQELWKRLSAVTRRRGPEAKIEWRYVRGHTENPGNERCDEIAVGFSKGHRPALFSGSILKYDVAIHDVPETQALPEMKPKNASPKQAHSYLSFVNGTLTRHADWRSCEAATKGRPGARFKKAMSPGDEETIVQEWGLSLDRLKSLK